MNSRLNCRRVIATSDLVKHPNLGVHQIGSSSALGSYALDDPADFKRMLVLMALYERAAAFPERRFPNDQALGRRIHDATDGINGQIALLTKRATELATRRGKPGLSRDILAEAFASLAELSDEGRHNPFLSAPRGRKEKADETRVTALHAGSNGKAA